MANKIVKDLNQGSVTKTMILFAMPLLLSGVIQMLYNTADMIIIGHFVGTKGLAAVSVGGDVMHFLAFAAMGFANAGQVIISQYLGAGMRDRAGKLIGTLFTFLLSAALIPALVNSGFPCDRFCFEGFLPQKKGRMKQLQCCADEERTMIFYESPYRVVKCLEQFAEVFGEDRPMTASRELTKKFEQTGRGTVAEVLAHFRAHEPKGEFVLVVSGKPHRKKNQAEENDDDQD